MSLPALPQPGMLAVSALHERCAAVAAWAEGESDLGRLEEARRWMAVVEAYLAPKKAAGPAMTAARLIEARIGHLDKKRQPGPSSSFVNNELGRRLRHDFRLMDAHREVWQPQLPLSRSRALALIRKTTDEHARTDALTNRPSCDLRLGDFRDVLADIPDGSVDLILTDPPYPAEFLPLWSDLAVFAARVLRPGGSLAAMSGHSYLPDVIARLGERLTYQWTLAYLTPGGQAAQVFPRRVTTFWKPILWYVQGDYQGRWVADVARSAVNDDDKRLHEWGQSESGMADVLRRLAEPGQIVCDPFAGGGTTALVALAHGCPFIGAEIASDTFRRASERIAA